MAPLLTTLDLSVVHASPLNTRKKFCPEKLEELAISIRQYGVLQPIIVRPKESGQYEIAAGERRWRASQMADQLTIPAVVRDMTDDQLLQVMILENLQREDVHPLEEADGFRRLVDRGIETYATIAGKVGKTEAYVRGRYRLAGLTGPARVALEKDLLPIGHALVIASFPEEDHAELARLANLNEHGDLAEHWRSMPSLASFRQHVQSSRFRDIQRAFFDILDSSLHPAGRSCQGCPSRTSVNAFLFPDLAAEDKCGDRKCWDTKLAAHVERMRLRAESGELLPLSSEWTAHAAAPGLLPRNWWKEPAKVDGIGALLDWVDDEDLVSDDSLWIDEAEYFPAAVDGDTMDYIRQSGHAASARTGDNVEVLLTPSFTAFVESEYGARWPGLDSSPVDMPDTKKGVILEGHELGRVLDVVLINEDIAPKMGEAAKAAVAEERAENREKARQRKAEMIARKMILDETLEKLTTFEFRTRVDKVIPVIAFKLATLDTNVYAAKDPQDGRHPGRDSIYGLLGLKGSHWQVKRSTESIDCPLQDGWKALVIAATSDEIHIPESGDATHPIALELFAGLAKVDTDLCRRKATWSTMTKKQQAENPEANPEAAL